MVYNLFDKTSALLVQSETLPTRAAQNKSASGNGIKNENMSNQELAKK